MDEVETTWRLDVDLATGRANFEVEYHSHFSGEHHEDIHKALCRKAQELLRKIGVENPDWRRPSCAELRVVDSNKNVVDSKVNTVTVYELKLPEEEK